MRKIAANYVFMPAYPLLKYGYVILDDKGVAEVVDTAGKMQEIAGLEFYGGLLVPDYIREYKAMFVAGENMLPLLEQLFAKRGNIIAGVAIIEGADLRELTWKARALIRLL